MSAPSSHGVSSTAPDDPLRGVLYMTGASIGFAVMAALVKLAGREVSTFTVLLGRSLVVTLVALWLVRARGFPWRATNRRLMLWRSASGFAAMACYFYALARVPLANAVTLQYTSPLFVALFAGFTVRERVSPRLAALSALAFVGVFLIVSPEVGAFDTDALFALASAVLASFAYLAVRGLRTTERPETIVLQFGLFSLVGSLPGVALIESWPSAAEMAVLLGVGLAASAGQIGISYAFRYTGAALGSAFSYTTVVFSAGLGLVLFAERPTPRALVGSALVVGAGVLLSLLEARGALARTPIGRSP